VSAAFSTPSSGTRKLLLVEDNEADVELITLLLAGSRYDVTAVGSVAGAEAALAGEMFELVLLDLHLPDCGPQEAVRRLVARTGAGSAVLAITHGDAEIAQEALEAGLQDFIRKGGLSTSTLVRALDHADIRARAAEVGRRLEIAERLATLGALAAYVGHEVNNQVALILAGLEQAALDLQSLRDQVPAELQGTIATAMANLEEKAAVAVRCGAVLEQLKLLESPIHGSPAATDVGALVDRCVRTMGVLLRGKGAVSLDLAPCGMARIEEHKLAQVLLNLLRNAAEALQAADATTPGGKPALITVSLRETNSQVVMTVSDTGPGIPPDRRATLFRPFFSSKPRGTGMGLAIAAEIVAAAGGIISEDSAPGQGATFTIKLPRARPPAARALVPASNAPRRYRVLFVEDDPGLRRAVGSLLRRHHDVIDAADGEEALAILASSKDIEVILCDLMMRGIDGLGVYEAVCRDHVELRSRFAFLTGGAFTEDAKKIIASGQVPVLQKPCTIQQICATVATLGARKAP
jgi:signal transduction histidine kinase